MLSGMATGLLYLVGVAVEIIVMSSIYLVRMPVGRISDAACADRGWRQACWWEVTRRVLVWYYAT